MKKALIGLLTFIVVSFTTYTYGSEVITLITETGKYEKVTIASGEATVFGFPRKIENITFSKDSGFTIRTLEGGVWKDLSNNITDYSPITGILARNISEGDLVITATYADINTIENTIFQKSLKAGWNLISPAYKNDVNGIVYGTTALGDALPYSQILDFTGNGFVYSGEAVINTPNHNLNNTNYQIKTKAELANANLIEKLAYGLFVNVDSVISGSQKLTANDFNELVCDEVSYLLNLCDNSLLGTSSTVVEATLSLASKGLIENHNDNLYDYDLNGPVTTQLINNILDTYLNEAINGEITGTIPKIDSIYIIINRLYSDSFTTIKGNINWQADTVLFATEKGIVSSFTDYDSETTKGYVYEALNNAIVASNEVVEACDEVSQLLGLCTNFTSSEVNCSSNQVFNNNSCNSCYTKTSNSLTRGNFVWNNVTDLTKILYKSEQILPTMINLLPSEVTWSIPTWDYDTNLESVYSIAEEGYLLSTGNTIGLFENDSTYSLTTNNTSTGGLEIGLLTAQIVDHNILADGTISIDNNVHKNCVLITNEDAGIIPTVIETPTNFQITQTGATQIGLSWDIVNSATSYKINYGTDEVTILLGLGNIENTTSTGITISLLEPETTYYFGIQALDQNNTVSTVSIIQATTTACDEVSLLLGLCGIQAPNNLQAINIGTGSIDLVWDTVTNGFMYYVQYGTGTQNYTNQTDFTESGSITIGNLTPGTTYYSTAVALDVDGTESSPSNELETITTIQ